MLKRRADFRCKQCGQIHNKIMDCPVYREKFKRIEFMGQTRREQGQQIWFGVFGLITAIITLLVFLWLFSI